MPNAAELTTIISEATGVSKATVALVIRVLREAELLTSGGRGRHSAQMTSLDAAYVLVAMLFTDRPVDSAKAIEDAKRLVFASVASIATDGESAFDFTDANALGTDGACDPRDFFSAVAYLIETLSLFNDELENEKSPTVRITFNNKDFGCQIETSKQIIRYTIAESWAAVAPNLSEKGKESLRFFHAMRESYRKSKMGIVRTWDFETIYTIAQAFAKI